MSKLQKRETATLGKANAMLKHSDENHFKKLIAGFLLKCIKLNNEPMPDPESLTLITDELFELLQASWPGVRPDQLWATFKNGMARQGQYRVRINYPTVANWVLYQRVVKVESQRSKELEEMTPSIDEQVRGVLQGLKEYRERVKAGEYKPQGRGE